MAQNDNGQSTGRRRRRTQQERRDATRSALLKATIECLVEYGYDGTTSARVSERAGVSRGGKLHHFHTMASLMADSIQYLAHRRTGDLHRAAAKLPQGEARIEGAVDLLWSSFSGPLFQASLELWVAARTDEELRNSLAPVEKQIGREITQMMRDVMGPELAGADDFDSRVQVALNLMRGLATLRTFQRERRAIDRQWATARATIVAMLRDGLPGKSRSDGQPRPQQQRAGPRA